jgi:hypothetical protein
VVAVIAGIVAVIIVLVVIFAMPDKFDGGGL